MFSSGAPNETCVEHGCRISAEATTDHNPLSASRKASLTTEEKRDGTLPSNAARMRLQDDLYQTGKKEGELPH